MRFRRKHGSVARRGAVGNELYAYQVLAEHFPGVGISDIVTSSRVFPGHIRVDLQSAIEQLLVATSQRVLGILEHHRYETLTFAALTRQGQQASVIAPIRYEEVDIGDAVASRCLTNGLWLCHDGGTPYAVLLSHHREYGQEAGVQIEIAITAGGRGADLVERSFDQLEAAISQSRAYRGKVLSLEQKTPYAGRSGAILVHRLQPVNRAEVILSPDTLELLDRNVFRFVASREGLRALGQSTKKGILLYGPPGTGKTHTIRYLASNLPGHTTLIVTAEQVGLLAEYMTLARLLQPSIVIIEDADLIARAREQMGGPCEEVLLNKLLNEMDGLREDADILFVLTTNRPDQLEAALAARPGRIDQAIEVPLPDEACRDRLIRLYGKGLVIAEPVVREAVRRTTGVSAAFIKELMRRAA
jgi:hypothetical protein